MGNEIVWSLVASMVLYLAGVIYAIYIAMHPFRPGLTWLEVAIGVGGVDLAATVIILILSGGNIILALVIWWCTALAGGTMIVGQVIKNAAQERDSEALTRFVKGLTAEKNRGAGGYKTEDVAGGTGSRSPGDDKATEEP